MKLWLSAGAAAVLLAAVAAWLLSAPRPAFSRADWSAYEAGGDAERGRIAFLAGGCSGCHAKPDQDDPLKLGGGARLKTAFGTFVPPNISSDEQDGIGRWKVVDLANALLAGVSPGGEHYYPAMPYTSYANMSLADVRDLMEYLRTTPAVKGRAPNNSLPFPFSIRRGVGLWKLLYFSRGSLTTDPARSAAWNRGRYLALGPGHCAECHSPRNFAGAIVQSRRFAGGVTPGNHKAPNLTQGGALARWSASDIATAVSTGVTPHGDFLDSEMGDVVRNFGQLPESDVAAVADYIKSLPALPSAGK